MYTYIFTFLGRASPRIQTQGTRDTARDRKPPRNRPGCKDPVPGPHGVPAERPAEQREGVQADPGTNRVGLPKASRDQGRGNTFLDVFLLSVNF